MCNMSDQKAGDRESPVGAGNVVLQGEWDPAEDPLAHLPVWLNEQVSREPRKSRGHVLYFWIPSELWGGAQGRGAVCSTWMKSFLGQRQVAWSLCHTLLSRCHSTAQCPTPTWCRVLD